MHRIALYLTVLVAVFATGAAAQIVPDVGPGRSMRTRADLEALLASYEQVLQSPAYSDALKRSVRANAGRVQARLEYGDFRQGDRVVLYIEGEPGMPDTIAVESGPMVSIPLFGDIALDGVLRSELQAHMAKALSSYIREPVVRAQGLMRISVQGAVVSPGFFVVPADMLLSEALMVAGGPSGTAQLDALRIERGQQILIEGEDLQEAIREGRTLDQLDLQAGDQFLWEAQGRDVLTTLGLFGGVFTMITGFIILIG